MGNSKGAHHRGQHQRLARLVVNAANANPDTRCARCGRTLDQHPDTKTGKRPHWTAGHKVDGKIATSVTDYQPEANTCNYAAGATHGNRNRERHTERWW